MGATPRVAGVAGPEVLANEQARILHDQPEIFCYVFLDRVNALIIKSPLVSPNCLRHPIATLIQPRKMPHKSLT
jgi:hypothetical protein